MKIAVKKGEVTKEIPIGFSWNQFLFSFLHLFFIGRWKSGLLFFTLFATIPFSLGVKTGYFVYFLINIFYSTIFNRQHAAMLLSNGFFPLSTLDKDILKQEELDAFLLEGMQQ